jgi:hypothetical protein
MVGAIHLNFHAMPKKIKRPAPFSWNSWVGFPAESLQSEPRLGAIVAGRYSEAKGTQLAACAVEVLAGRSITKSP